MSDDVLSPEPFCSSAASGPVSSACQGARPPAHSVSAGPRRVPRLTSRVRPRFAADRLSNRIARRQMGVLALETRERAKMHRPIDDCRAPDWPRGLLNRRFAYSNSWWPKPSRLAFSVTLRRVASSKPLGRWSSRAIPRVNQTAKSGCRAPRGGYGGERLAPQSPLRLRNLTRTYDTPRPRLRV